MADSTTRSGNSTAVVAVVAILAILALVWFFFLGGNAAVSSGSDGPETDVDITTTPGGTTITRTETE